MTTHQFVQQDILMDPFMTEADRLVSTHPTRNLLGAPVQPQLLFDHLPRFRLDADGFVKASIDGQKMGLLGSITSLAAIAP